MKENGVKNRKPPTRGEGLLLTGLLYCGECGQKFTSSHWSERRTRRDGTIWEYATDRYRCISYIKPKERNEQCHRTVYRVSEVDEAVLADTKQFLASLNKEKIIDDYGEGLNNQLKEITEQIKKIARDVSQKERELQKLKDEVLKVIMGESQFSQSILSDLIQQREKELVELAKRRESEERAKVDLESQIKLRKTVRDEYKDWEQRFDTLTIQEKRAMLIKVIDRIIIYPDRVHTICKVKVDVFQNATIETTQPESDSTSSSGISFYPKQLVNTDALAMIDTMRKE